jgi:hypothetical protein
VAGVQDGYAKAVLEHTVALVATVASVDAVIGALGL